MLAFLLVAVLLDPSLRAKAGDDPRWASPQFDDSSWRRLGDISDVRSVGTVWFRREIDLSKVKRAEGHPLAIYFSGMASHEIWWDGERIGRGGVVGRTAAEEVPGPIEAHYQIPDRLATPGVHLIAIRASAFHRGFTPLHGYWGNYVADYDYVVRARTEGAHLALVAMSSIVLTAVFAFAMFWLARRDRSFLLLGTLCLAAAAMLLAEVWRPLFGYTYDWQIVRLRTTVVLAWLVGMQLVALVVTRFPHRFGKHVLAATALVATTLPYFPRAWDLKSIVVLIVTFAVAAVWTLIATIRKLPGSRLALIGVAAPAASIWIIDNFLDHALYFSLDVLFICLLCSHALEVKRDRQERSEALLRSSRLELEMLKRHLQPHFLMNTLTALSEWIEQDPKTAVRMIESLSDELRMLAELSTQRLVRAGDELRLCRNHLAIMSLRKDIAYTLEVDGVDAQQLVPPAVFHTLVENAITHGLAAERVTLKLTAKRDGERTSYVFESPAGDADIAPPGGGTRYVEARLREVWGDAWTFRQSRADGVWRAEIEVPA